MPPFCARLPFTVIVPIELPGDSAPKFATLPMIVPLPDSRPAFMNAPVTTPLLAKLPVLLTAPVMLPVLDTEPVVARLLSIVPLLMSVPWFNSEALTDWKVPALLSVEVAETA